MDLQVDIDTSGDALLVKLSGSLTEFSEEALSRLHKYSQKSATINFEALEQLNSSGVRIWTFFIAAFTAKRKVTFINCPEIVVTQCAMIPQVSKNCDVQSIVGRFRCAKCQTITKQLYDLAALREEGLLLDPDTGPPCAKCGMILETMEDETFFDFINEGLPFKGVTR